MFHLIQTAHATELTAGTIGQLASDVLTNAGGTIIDVFSAPVLIGAIVIFGVLMFVLSMILGWVTGSDAEFDDNKNDDAYWEPDTWHDGQLH